ncbi:MAG: histidine kinase, partial [Paenibacillus sp.]|nr:histidine kinase [Paenibacillus sp.]
MKRKKEGCSMQFRTKLTLLFIALIGCSVLVAGIFMAVMIEKSKVSALQNSMQREIQIMIAAIGIDENQSPYANMTTEQFSQIANRLKQSAGARITFIS